MLEHAVEQVRVVFKRDFSDPLSAGVGFRFSIMSST